MMNYQISGRAKALRTSRIGQNRPSGGKCRWLIHQGSGLSKRKTPPGHCLWNENSQLWLCAGQRVRSKQGGLVFVTFPRLASWPTADRAGDVTSQLQVGVPEISKIN
eukprot:s1890_g13.t1